MPLTENEQLKKNTFHWRGLCEEDPKASKIVGKPYKGTSPRPMHMIKKMTAAFGPIGVGWGYHIIEHWSEDIPDLENSTVSCVMVFVKLRLSVREGMPWETIGSCKKVYVSKGQNSRLVVDEDAYKKATTDALTKGLSHIGVCANTYGLQTDAEPEELGKAEPERNIGHELNDYFRARCKDLGVETDKHPGSIDMILRELGIAKTIQQLDLHKEKIIEAIGKWEPAKAGDFDDPNTPNPADPERSHVRVGDTINTLCGQQGGKDSPKVWVAEHEAPTCGACLAKLDKAYDEARPVNDEKDDDEANTILRYMHGEVSRRLEVDGDTAHRYLKSALPSKFEDDLKRVNTMKLAKALVERTFNLITTGKPVREKE